MTATPITSANIGATPPGLVATAVGDLLPAVVLTAQFTAVGASATVAVPSGVTGGVLQLFPTGAPTVATVVIEASVDSITWVPLPAASQSPPAVTFPFVRLHCTALAGGTSPTVIALGITAP